jgi:hypothetical protein
VRRSSQPLIFAARNPMNDKSPTLGVSVFPSYILPIPYEPINTAYLHRSDNTSGGRLLKKRWEDIVAIDQISWAIEKLYINYSVVNARNSFYKLILRNQPPVSTILKRTNL